MELLLLVISGGVSFVGVLLGVLLGFVIRGSFILGELRGTMEEGFERMDERLNRMETRLDRINDELKEIRAEVKETTR